MAFKFMTSKGASTASPTPYYIGFPQHERSMSKKEAYAFFAERTGYKPAAVRAVFLALAAFVKENADKGNITHIDGIASVRHFVKGTFEGLGGPWTKGRNMIAVSAIEIDPFKSMLAGIVPVNNTEGAKPFINTVFDESTGEYDEITCRNTISVAGRDLNPDTSKSDEGVYLVAKDGTKIATTISYSDLQNVKFVIEADLEAGDYTLEIYTRSGMGEEYGVNKVTRRVTVK